MRDQILSEVEYKSDLPPLPKVLIKLQELINDPDCDVDDVHRLIKSDLVLMGKLITLSNSVFYGGGRDKVENLEDAIVRLGMQMVLDLCYSVELPRAFGNSKAFDQVKFWQHSLGVGYINRMLARKLIDDDDAIESSFLSGLMHDIGILVFDYIIPKEYNQFLRAKEFRKSEESIEALERAAFGIDHQELGALFLKKWWPVPPILIDAVGAHHDDSINNGKSFNLTHTVNAANLIANLNGIANPIMTKHRMELNENFLKQSGITDADLAEFVQKAQIGLLAFATLLQPGP